MKQVKFLASAALVVAILFGQSSFAAVQKEVKEKKEKTESKAKEKKDNISQMKME